MLRDRLKEAARRLGERIRKRSDPRDPAPRRDPVDVDRSVIPPVQAGRGDTPGPSHGSEIGGPWVAAQILAGGGVVVVDVRSPEEWAAGHLPGALLLPAPVADQVLDRVPGRDTDTFVAVYDAVGGEDSARLAALLRERGWSRARRLVGGWAGWLEGGEELSVPEPIPGARYKVGDTVRLDGATGTVWSITTGPEPRYDILVHASEGTWETRAESELEP